MRESIEPKRMGHDVPCAYVQRLDARVAGLERHADSQNGFIRELRTIEIPGLREEIGHLRDAMDRRFEALAEQLDRKVEGVSDRAEEAKGEARSLDDKRGERSFRLFLALLAAGLSLATATATTLLNYLIQHYQP